MHRPGIDRPLVMGILNVTPDSFSDGGRYLATEAAIAHGLEMVAEGADIIDVGGESSRPGAEPVPEAVEMARVIPVIEALAPRVRVSIDTVKPAVAAAALEAGASVVNDVSSSLAAVAAAGGAGWVADAHAGLPGHHAGRPALRRRRVRGLRLPSRRGAGGAGGRGARGLGRSRASASARRSPTTCPCSTTFPSW